MPQRTYGSMKKLKKLSELKQYKSIKDRIMAIIYFKKGRSLRDTARILGYAASWVKKWIDRYKEGGVENLFDKTRPGRPKKLKDDFEADFINRIQNGPVESDDVSVFCGIEIKKILEDEFNVSYSTSGVYSLLHRLGLNKIKPRPYHYKKDNEKTNAWLEELPSVVNNIKKDNPEKNIEFFFKMNQDSEIREKFQVFG